MKMMKNLLVVVAALLLTACFTTKPVTQWHEHTLAKDQGSLLISIIETQSAEQNLLSANWQPRVHLRKVGTQKTYTLPVRKLSEFFYQPSDFESEKGYVSVLNLAPGEYEIYDWSILLDAEIDQEEAYHSPQKISRKLTIRTGHVTYAGSVRVKIFTREKAFGVHTFQRAEATFEDQLARDRAIASKKFPELDLSNIQTDQVGSL